MFWVTINNCNLLNVFQLARRFWRTCDPLTTCNSLTSKPHLMKPKKKIVCFTLALGKVRLPDCMIVIFIVALVMQFFQIFNAKLQKYCVPSYFLF